MSNKKLEKKIDAIIAEQGWLWGSIFITGGGSFTLFITNNTLIGRICSVIGVVLCILFINAFFIRRNELIKALEQLNNKE